MLAHLFLAQKWITKYREEFLSLSYSRINNSLILKQPRMHVIKSSFRRASSLSDQPVYCNAYCIKRKKSVWNDWYSVRILLIKILAPSTFVWHIYFHAGLEVLLTFYALCHAHNYELEVVIMLGEENFSLQWIHDLTDTHPWIEFRLEFNLDSTLYSNKKTKRKRRARQINEDKLVVAWRALVVCVFCDSTRFLATVLEFFSLNWRMKQINEYQNRGLIISKVIRLTFFLKVEIQKEDDE